MDSTEVGPAPKKFLQARLKQCLAKWKWWLPVGVLLGIVLLVAVPVYAFLAAGPRTFSVDEVPARDVAIVFGAGLQPDNKPSSYLESRLVTAARLYKNGKVKALLLTGDNGVTNYDEPTAMQHYLELRGVPTSAMVLDFGGFGTYDSCHRARAIFGVEQAILVTHGYHAPRAIMTCRALGVDSIAVDANYRHNRPPVSYLVREFVSLDKAAFELVLKPNPKVLGPKESAVTEAVKAYQGE